MRGSVSDEVIQIDCTLCCSFQVRHLYPHPARITLQSDTSLALIEMQGIISQALHRHYLHFVNWLQDLQQRTLSNVLFQQEPNFSVTRRSGVEILARLEKSTHTGDTRPSPFLAGPRASPPLCEACCSQRERERQEGRGRRRGTYAIGQSVRSAWYRPAYAVVQYKDTSRRIREF